MERIMFNDEMQIALYAMLLGRDVDAEGDDVMDAGECDHYVEDINRDTVTGGLRMQEDWNE
jgi:hypothetical protein